MGRAHLPLLGLLLACAGACRAPARQLEGEPRELLRGDFHLLVGQRELDDEEAWSDLSDQLAGGVIWTREDPWSLVGWEVGLLGSVEDTTVRTPFGPDETAELDAVLFEASLGLVKSFPLGRVRPYLGAGVSLLHVELETTLGDTSEVLREDDDLFGLYARGGILLQWTPVSHVGIDWRMLRAGQESLADFDYDVDYQQLALVFGASF